MNHPEEINKTSPNCIIKWVLKERQHSPTPACVSLDEPEPVDSVLTFLSGYDIMEYSWVKATAISVRLRILFVMLQNTNKLFGTVAGER